MQEAPSSSSPLNYYGEDITYYVIMIICPSHNVGLYRVTLLMACDLHSFKYDFNEAKV